MSEGSPIGWLLQPYYESWTLNVGIGCVPVSEGCDLCFAPKSAARQAHYAGRDGVVTKDDQGRSVWTGKVVLFPERLDKPRHVKTPHMIFINALMDLFSAAVPEEFIGQVWQMMADTPQHIYVILTKQPKRMRDIVTRMAEKFGVLANAWVGVSIEHQRAADIRLPFLRQTPIAVPVVSCEPLLGPIVFGRSGLDGISWVIAGGESGRRADARPMHPLWVRDLRDQATAASVPFFFKQWGSWGPAPWVVRVCDPAQGWNGTADELSAAKAAAEKVGATHSYPVWAHRYGHQPYEPPHKPWSGERRELTGDVHAPIRFYPGKTAGHELDGRAWQQWPGPDGQIIEAPTTQEVPADA